MIGFIKATTLFLSYDTFDMYDMYVFLIRSISIDMLLFDSRSLTKIYNLLDYLKPSIVAINSSRYTISFK